MRLMTGLARFALRMFFGVDLRKSSWFGGVSRMASHAESSNLGQHGLNGTRIIRVFRLRPVAGFAVDSSVHALGFGLLDIRVTTLADIVSRKHDGVRGDFGEGGPAVRTVASKTLWNYGRTDHDKRHRSQKKNGGNANQMCRVPEFTHFVPHWRERRAMRPIPILFAREMFPWDRKDQ